MSLFFTLYKNLIWLILSLKTTFLTFSGLLTPESMTKFVINPKYLKLARFPEMKDRAEVSQTAEQTEEPAEFDSTIQELPEFAHIQKQDEPSSLVQDPTEDINIGSEDDPKILKIGSSLSEVEKARLIQFL